MLPLFWPLYDPRYEQSLCSADLIQFLFSREVLVPFSGQYIGVGDINP